MKILAIYPGLNPGMNEYAYVMQALADMGHEVTVITARANPMKGIADSAPLEISGNLRIHRPYRNHDHMMYAFWTQRAEVARIAAAAAPDIILCSQEYNFLLARMIQRQLKVPMALAVEDAGRIARGHFPGRLRPKLLRLLGVPITASRYWPWLASQSDAIMTYDSTDIPRLESLSTAGAPVSFIPWCNPLPDGFIKPPSREKRVVYIGTFNPHKNTNALGWAIPQILEQTPTEQALLIGPGDTAVVDTLKQRYGDRIRYLAGCSRLEALAYLAGSHFAFTPLKAGYGGFIGDAWNVETPLLTVSGTVALIDGEDALVPASDDMVGALARQLYDDPALYRRLQEGGARRAAATSAPAVAASIADVLAGCLARKQGKNSA